MKGISLPFLEHIGAVLEELSKEKAVLRAVISNLPEDKTAVTIEIKINYLKPAKRGTLKAIGKVLKLGEKVAFAVVELYSDKELVAYATGTYAILDYSKEK